MTEKPTYVELEQRVLALEQTVSLLSEKPLMENEDRFREIVEKERKRISNALHESESKMKSIFRAAPVGIGVVTDRVFQEVNERFCQMTGYSRDELIGKTARMVYPTDEAYEHVGVRKYELIDKTGTGAMDTQFKRKDGKIIDVLLSSTPINKADLSLGVTFTALDITERKMTEAALYESENKFFKVFKNAPLMMTIATLEDGKFIDVNDAFVHLTEYSRDKAVGATATGIGFVQREDQDRLLNILENEGGIHNIELAMTKNDGTRMPCLYSAELIEIKGKKHLLSIAGDISEKKRAETRIRNSEARFRDLMKILPEAVFEADLEMNLHFANQKAYSIFGYSQKDLKQGINGYNLLVPEDRKKARANAEKRMRGEQFGMQEYRAIKKDGTIFPVLFHTSPIFENKELTGIRGIIIDITDRKKMEERLVESQKMESIGNLAGGIAHDFNNILSPIIGMSEMLLEDLPPGSLERENAEEIFKAGKRGSKLVNQILAFSRQSEHKLTPTRIQNILKEVLKLSRATIPSYIEIDQDIQPDCGLVMADPTQIHQVAMNIITNAFHAVEADGGMISVQLEEIYWTDSKLSEIHLEPGKYALLSISDTGHGMSAALMEKIFDPYFTTKAKGKGTGLGLAVVYGIVQAHKGGIKVRSEIGEGTIFNVYLPLMEKSVEIDRIRLTEKLPTGQERILLVDDELPIANLEKQILERLGYQVTMRVNSIETLEVFKTKPESFDLVISDMTMPNMTGDQLAREIKAIRFDIPIIICTGFSEKINKEKAVHLGIDSILMKPVIKSDMAETVRKILDKANNRK